MTRMISIILEIRYIFGKSIVSPVVLSNSTVLYLTNHLNIYSAYEEGTPEDMLHQHRLAKYEKKESQIMWLLYILLLLGFTYFWCLSYI